MPPRASFGRAAPFALHDPAPHVAVVAAAPALVTPPAPIPPKATLILATSVALRDPALRASAAPDPSPGPAIPPPTTACTSEGYS